MNFFEELASMYGLRVPQNRKKKVVHSNFKASYKEILTENTIPGILYGYGDPAVVRVDSATDTIYYLLATSNDAPNSFPILRSKNLSHWEPINFVFPEGKKPAWAADGEFISDFWAPEMIQVNGEFRVYFVARDKTSRELCIGMSRSSSPEGAFDADITPLISGNVIDPHVFVDTDGIAYLFWKEDNNDIWPEKLMNLLYDHPEFIQKLFPDHEDQVTASFIITFLPWLKKLDPMERFLASQVFIEAVISVYSDFRQRLKNLAIEQTETIKAAIGIILTYMKTPVYAQQLSPNGSLLTGEPTKIIENDLTWEAHLVEGVWLTKYSEKYYLFYTGNDFSTNQYGIGYAVADSALGPFKKAKSQLLKSTKQWIAPGHPSVVIAPNGSHAMFLHAYHPGKEGYKHFRALLSISLVFKDGEVVLGN
jgi:beta-xylosidase